MQSDRLTYYISYSPEWTDFFVIDFEVLTVYADTYNEHVFEILMHFMRVFLAKRFGKTGGSRVCVCRPVKL